MPFIEHQAVLLCCRRGCGLTDVVVAVGSAVVVVGLTVVVVAGVGSAVVIVVVVAFV